MQEIQTFRSSKPFWFLFLFFLSFAVLFHQPFGHKHLNPWSSSLCDFFDECKVFHLHCISSFAIANGHFEYSLIYACESPFRFSFSQNSVFYVMVPIYPVIIIVVYWIFIKLTNEFMFFLTANMGKVIFFLELIELR